METIIPKTVWPQCPKSVCAGVGCGLDWTLAPVCDTQHRCSLHGLLTCGAI